MNKAHVFNLVVAELISKRRILALIAAIPLVLAYIGTEVFAAGNVVSSMESGYLVLTGDGSANSIDIEQRPDGRYDITPRGGTTINGRGTTFTAAFGVDKVWVKLNGGDDHLIVGTFYDSSRTRFTTLVVEMGAGQDKVYFFGIDLLNTFISGLVNLGEGNDLFICAAAYIAGGFPIYAEGGDDEVNLYSVDFDNAPNAVGGGHVFRDSLFLTDCTYGRAWTPRGFERIEGF